MKSLRTRLALKLAPWLKPCPATSNYTLVFDHVKGVTYTAAHPATTATYSDWKLLR